MIAKHWEHFSHQADMGVRGIGATINEAFEQAAMALTAVIADPQTVILRESVDITCEAPDEEFLLVDWLNALIYEMATRKMLFGDFEVDLNHLRLKAKAMGEMIDIKRHQPAIEIKGATYTELEVRQELDGGWIAQCVVDV